MDIHFTTMHQNRLIFLKMLNKIPINMLVAIPEGFRNNIWWNISHVIATQQILMYRWSGLASKVNEDWVDTYKKGTFPEGIPTESDKSDLGNLLVQTAEWAWDDYQSGLFKSYTEYTTSTKVTIASIDDAIAFNNFHEGYHLGATVSLQKVLGIFPYR